VLTILSTAGVPRVIVDLAGVTFADTTAVTALVVAHALQQRDGRELAVRAPSPPVARLLDLLPGTADLAVVR
jgi:anti-anti-sigma regulatory factor